MKISAFLNISSKKKITKKKSKNDLKFGTYFFGIIVIFSFLICSITIKTIYGHNSSDDTNSFSLRTQDSGDVYEIDKLGQYRSTGLANIFLNGEIAYLADWQGLTIVNISDPSNSSGTFIKVGEYQQGYAANDVNVINNTAYLAESSGGLRIINITDPTNITGSFKEIGNLYDGGDARDIEVIGTLAYIADGSDGLEIINVTDPTNPQEIGQYDSIGTTNAVYIVGNKAYLADDTEGLLIIDISNPLNPQKIGQYKDQYIDGTNVYVTENIAYFSNMFYGLYIIDVSNPSNPKKIGSFVEVLGEAYDIYVENDVAFYADGANGLKILSVGNPSQPKLIAQKDESGTTTQVLVEGNLIYAIDVDQGLVIMEIAPAIIPSKIGSYKINLASKLSIKNNIAYVISQSEGLEILDLNDPTNPQLLSKFTSGISAFVHDIYIKGNLAYIANGPDGLLIINVNDLKHPQKVGELNDGSGDANGIFIKDDLAYLADGDDGLEIINVSKPQYPQKLGQCVNGLMNMQDVSVIGNIAYIADRIRGFVTVNVTNSSGPSELWRYSGPTEAWGVYVSGDHAYISDQENGLVIFDITDPANPSIFKQFDDGGNSYDVFVKDDFIFFGDGGDGLEIYTLTAKDTLKKIAKFDDGGAVLGVFAVGDFVYLADVYDGLEIIQIYDDYDRDLLSNYGERLITFTDPLKFDTDDDGLGDGIEFYRYKTDPNNYDTDGDGFSDGYEVQASTDPLDPNDYPRSFISEILFIVIPIIAVLGFFAILSYLRMKGILFKKPLLNIFISHAVADFDRFKIKEIAETLESKKNVNNVFFCEEDLKANIDEWMDESIPLTHIFLFFASNNSINSHDCQHEIELARKNDLIIIPIKAKELNWGELSKIKMARELGFDFEEDHFEQFMEKVVSYINKFKLDLDNLLVKLKTFGSDNIDKIEEFMNLSENQIDKYTKILIKMDKIEGAWTENNKAFLDNKGIIKRIKDDFPKIVNAIGIKAEYEKEVKKLIFSEKKGKQKIKVR